MLNVLKSLNYLAALGKRRASKSRLYAMAFSWMLGERRKYRWPLRLPCNTSSRTRRLERASGGPHRARLAI